MQRLFEASLTLQDVELRTGETGLGPGCLALGRSNLTTQHPLQLWIVPPLHRGNLRGIERRVDAVLRGLVVPVGQTLGPRLALGWSQVGRQDGLGPQRAEVIEQSLCVTVGVVQVRPPSDKLVGDCLEDGEGAVSGAGLNVGAGLLGELEDTIRRFAQVVARSQQAAHLSTNRGHGRGCRGPAPARPGGARAWRRRGIACED